MTYGLSTASPDEGVRGARRQLTGAIVQYLIYAIGLVGLLGLSPRISNASEGTIVFEVSVTKDTFVVYESIWVEFSAHNRGPEPFARRALIIGDQHIMVEAMNLETGEQIPTCVDAETYLIPQGRADLPVIAPGETYHGAGDLTHSATCNFDQDLRISYWSPGRYRAAFHWTYDPQGRSLIDGSPILSDSVEFVVVEPEGTNSDARSEFLSARRSFFADSQGRSAELMWEVVERYPQSPYAGQALKRLLSMMYQGKPLPPGVSKYEILLKFVSIAPDRPECSLVLRSLSCRMSSDEYQSYLKHLRSTMGDTYAGRRASRLLLQGGIE